MVSEDIISTARELQERLARLDTGNFRIVAEFIRAPKEAPEHAAQIYEATTGEPMPALQEEREATA